MLSGAVLIILSSDASAEHLRGIFLLFGTLDPTFNANPCTQIEA